MPDEHGPIVHALVVTATPGRTDDALQQAVRSGLEATGHALHDWSECAPDVGALREAVRQLATSGAQALLILGGSTAFEGHVTQQALVGLLSPRFPGFATLFAPLWHARVGSEAVWAETDAGLVGTCATFVLPPSAEAVDLALRSLIGPQLNAAVGAGVIAGRPVPGAAAPPSPTAFDLGPDPVTQEAVFEDIPDADTDADAEAPPPPPSGSLGPLGGPSRGLHLEAAPSADAAAPPAAQALPPAGWLRAVHELEGTVHLDRREELPQPVEKLAPFHDVLHNAGETGVLVLPSGVAYSLWGYPDLRRPGSKVLAVGWGKPLVELLALHRYPTPTGTTIAQDHGRLPHAREVAETTEAITGAAPPSDADALFAIDGTHVWLCKGSRVVQFDGRKETDLGTTKQALASLALAWSTR